MISISRDIFESGYVSLKKKKGLTLRPHITLQHSVGQLSSRLFDNLADFLKLFLCLCCFVLGVFLLSANETQLKDSR